MGWKINNNRILYENDKTVIFPTAEEIYSLNAGIPNGRFATAIEAPQKELRLRFSRIGAQIKIQILFEDTKRAIFIYLMAERGEKSLRLLYSNDELPDSIVIEETWYNLLTDYEEISEIHYSISFNESIKMTEGSVL